MATGFSSLLSSDMVLIAAEGDAQFYVHKDILALHSQPFRDTLSTVPAQLIVNLQDWDCQTVSRLIEFLYRGIYDYPDPAPVSPGNAPGKTGSILVLPMELTSVPVGNAVNDLERLCRFDPAHYDFHEPLLSHAKVYQLAQSGAIYRLRALALRRLLQTLDRIGSVGPTSGHHTVVAICHLVRNVYACTAYAPIDPPEHKEEGLQSHVSKFIACNFAAMRTNSEMVKLLSEGGNIVIDVMEILSNGSIALPSVPITLVTPPPAALRSGPVPSIVLHPAPPRPIVRLPPAAPPVVPSIASIASLGALPGGLRPITLASAVLPPNTSRPIVLPAVTVGIVGPAPPPENRYISQLIVSKSSLRCEKATAQFHERVSALGGKSGNISVGKDAVWLYVGYTKFPKGACTSFSADMEYKANGAVPIGTNRSIVPRRDASVKRKIISVALIRQKDAITDIAALDGGYYDGMTSDLHNEGNHVYLVWKSVLVNEKMLDPKNVSS